MATETFRWNGLDVVVREGSTYLQSCKGPADLAVGVWELTRCEGDVYGPGRVDRAWGTSRVVRLAASVECAEAVNRAQMPVMGCRVLHGELQDGSVVLVRRWSGRFCRRDMTTLLQAGVTRVWGSTFVPKTWAVDGRLEHTAGEIELNPGEGMKHAMAWAGALTGCSTGVVLTREEMAGEAEVAR